MKLMQVETNGTSPKLGIREQIRHAESIPQLDALLKRLASFDQASDRTKQACRNAAVKRRRELEGAR